MNDQAAQLREIVKKQTTVEQKQQSPAKIITITSGKGGVGKSNAVINIAMSLQELGKKVVILDADFGLANVEVLLGIVPRYNLSHVLNGSKNICDIIERSGDGIEFISGGSGIQELMFLRKDQIIQFAQSIAELEKSVDYILIDTSAGITDVVLSFCKLAHEVIFITTPEPTSITDAYALMKTFQATYESNLPVFKILINKAETIDEAQQVYIKLSKVCKHFLKINTEYLGYVPFDYNVMKASKLQEPICKSHKKSSASIAYQMISKSIVQTTCDTDVTQKKGNFFRQVLQMFTRN